MSVKKSEKGFACLIDALRSRKMLRSIGGAAGSPFGGPGKSTVGFCIDTFVASPLAVWSGMWEARKLCLPPAANQRVAVRAAGGPGRIETIGAITRR